MKLYQLIPTGLVMALSAICSLSGQDTPSVEEMWRIIQAQQKQIAELTAMVEANKKEVSATSSAVEGTKLAVASAKTEAETAREEVQVTRQQLEATALAVEEMSQGGSGGLGWWDKTSIGGYGELHANFFSNASDQIDFHRFVLFFNHEFNDWITFSSELELEHALSSADGPGEVELEQAFIRMDWSENFSTDAGLFLMPIGIINEIHEPNTFYGVERNNVESRIIPSTWWEAGIKGTYRFDNGMSVEGGVVSGLDVGPSGNIRSGRQKVAQAINNEAAFVGRIKYTGVAGLELGLSAFHQGNLSQSSSVDVSGLLTSAHADYSSGGFRLRALYSHWDLDGTTNADAETQYGYYFEPSYRWELSDEFGDLGIYIRYSEYEYFTGSFLSFNEISELGINYWPTDQVVFKVDLQDISKSRQLRGKGSTAFNLGLGYQF
ncbi:MAG: porin [Verrucomicrobia bacterium]|nr:porin [Verrucomicrobiota bacterium]